MQLCLGNEHWFLLACFWKHLAQQLIALHLLCHSNSIMLPLLLTSQNDLVLESMLAFLQLLVMANNASA